jgi:hypothetical protein
MLRPDVTQRGKRPRILRSPAAFWGRFEGASRNAHRVIFLTLRRRAACLAAGPANKMRSDTIGTRALAGD